MVTPEEMRELVQAHAGLDEPMTTAIWIRRQDREAWLVEVIPSMAKDPHPERHVAFGPGRFFRHALNLIAGNVDDLKEAIRREPSLADAIAEGEVLYGEAEGEALKRFAEESRGGHSRAG
jgi:hypothetical protein